MMRSPPRTWRARSPENWGRGDAHDGRDRSGFPGENREPVLVDHRNIERGSRELAKTGGACIRRSVKVSKVVPCETPVKNHRTRVVIPAAHGWLRHQL